MIVFYWQTASARAFMIGNLTWVNRHLNPAAGDAAFVTKLSEYQNSVLRMNRYFSEFDEWDAAAITTRSKLLGEAICAIWPRPQASGS